MRWRSALVAAVTGAVALLAPVALAPAASAHGWITDPPSRQDHCGNGTVDFDCGGLQYEPQSVEAPKGSMQCSGGSGFDLLDDESLAWPRTTIGSTVTMKWQLTAMHSTSTWEYFVDGVLHRTFDDGGAQPGAIVEHELDSLPAGDHTILARWNVADTPMAFYNCVDVTVTGNGGGDPDPTPTPDPTPEPGDCEATAWDSAAVYLGGDQVSYDGHTYQAKWWTRGEDPSSAGQWGVWSDIGAC